MKCRKSLQRASRAYAFTEKKIISISWNDILKALLVGRGWRFKVTLVIVLPVFIVVVVVVIIPITGVKQCSRVT